MSSLDVPNGWITASIDDVATSFGGGTPSKSDPSYWTNGSTPWVSPKDMKTFHIRSSEDLVTEKALAKLTKIPGNSILVVVRSGILARTLPVAINTTPVTINQDMRAFVPEAAIDPRFIAWQLIADEREILNDCSKDGTTVASIEGSALSAYPLKIAPIPEQTRIVEKLEELLSDLDAGVAELRVAQSKLTLYRQSLLKAAVEGELTVEWRASHGKPQETGAELLKRILSERRSRWEHKQRLRFAEQGKSPPKGWQAKYRVPVVPDVTKLPPLPTGWAWATVDQCAFDEDGITDGPFGSNLKSEHYTDTGPRVIRLQNIGDGRFLDARAHISEERYERLRKHAVIENDVVVAMLGEVLPRSCVVPAGIAPAIVKADCARVRLNPELIPPALVVAILNAEPTRKRVNRLVKGIGRPRVNLGHIRSIPVPVPPRAEQDQILRVLSESLESCDNQNLAIERGFSISVAQRKNILKTAFAGQLVPQHPDDEPASELLARIRDERAKKALRPKVRNTKQAKEIAVVASRLIDVLAEANDWLTAQEAFRRCGIAHGASTDQIERLYAELRVLDKSGRLQVQPLFDALGRKRGDKLKLGVG